MLFVLPTTYFFVIILKIAKDNKMIKEIVFCDIDGTLKNSKGIITERNKQAISKLENINVAFVLCSGRTRQHVEKVALEVNASQYIISSNGSDVYDFKNKVEIVQYYLKGLFEEWHSNWSDDENIGYQVFSFF